jgi:hypothetical protein
VVAAVVLLPEILLDGACGLVHDGSPAPKLGLHACTITP